MSAIEYEPSPLQSLLWDLTAAEIKLSDLRGAPCVERLVALAELQEILDDAQCNVRAALREIEAEIRAAAV